MRLTAQQMVLILAVVCFGLVSIVDVSRGINWHDLVPIGLTLFAASHL